MTEIKDCGTMPDPIASPKNVKELVQFFETRKIAATGSQSEKTPHGIVRKNSAKVALKTIESSSNIAYSAATALSRVASFGATRGPLVRAFISPTTCRVANAMLFVAVVPGIFAVPHFFSALKKMCMAPTAELKGKAALRALDNGVNIAWAAVDSACALEAVGAVAAGAIAWTEAAGIVLLPLTGVLLGYEAYKINAFRKFREEFDANVEKIRVEESTTQKEHKIKRALKYLQASDSKKMQKALEIPKVVDVANMTKKLYEEVQKPETREASLQKSEKLINNLSKRVSIKWWTSLFSLVMKVIGVAVAALFLLTPVGQILLLCGAVAAVVGLGIQAYGYFALRAQNKELLALQKA